MDWARSDKRCPSPVGMGRHVPFLNILDAAKLVKLMPNVPTTRPPPQPPLSSIWSEGFSSTVYSTSTVPSSGCWMGFTPNASGLKYPSWESSRWVRMMSVRLNKSPGRVRISRYTTWSLVLLLPWTNTRPMRNCWPSIMRTSMSIVSPSTRFSMGRAWNVR